ncbi:glycoside hydrolase family 27 protein [candidate division KSB1 bacterium]|nr:glycoside hydrolase family 27 protein [candidate division KSB1 bacterium]
MKNFVLFSGFVFIVLFISCQQSPAPVAQTPPMGWNSWDCLGVDASEADLKTIADYMSEKLKPYGWEYVVTDILWYGGPDMTIYNYWAENPDQRIDEYGRLIPAVNRYPSAVDGSFKAVADYIHSKGLKFGIHVMRGIPKQAVEKDTPILDTEYRARDIVAYKDTCDWYDGMYGIDMDHPGGNVYYYSIIKLYAEWGVDYIKVDDISYPYHAKDIEALYNAIKTVGRPMVLSLSPGAVPIERAEHLLKYANMWRISTDFWDDWPFLYRQFDLCALWQNFVTPGHWPDADMLPMGKLRKHGPDNTVVDEMNLTEEEVTDEYSRFTDEEKKTMMTLWCIARSPLMLGGYLPENDEVTFSLITNHEALAVNQNSAENRQLFRRDDKVAWIASVPGSKDKYLALFNISDQNNVQVSVTLQELGVAAPYTVRNLWNKTPEGQFDQEFSVVLPAHGSGLYRIITH